MTPKMWVTMTTARPEHIAEQARQGEIDGWDGMTFADTQCLVGDTYVMMTAAALATERLHLSISTSNPATRHPAVTASAIASIAAIAGDRVSFGIGRGDSALAYVGGAPASVPLFERYVVAVRRYLHGEPVPFESILDWRLTRDVSTMELSHSPDDSRIVWLDPEATPPPIEVFATGPRVLAVAGRWADKVTIAVGADFDRIAWAIETARSARSDAGLDPATLSIGALMSVGVADDVNLARRSVANGVAANARFTIMGGSVVGPADAAKRSVYEAIGRTYDMNHHGGPGDQVNQLTDDFIDSFAIVGSPQRCIERILELHTLGIDYFVLGRPQEGYQRLVEEVLPEVRAATAIS